MGDVRIPQDEGRTDFRILRKQLGFSQTRCSEFLGVHRKTVQQWELCKRPMPAMAYLALFLLSETEHFATKSSAWDGWHIARDGRLYGPHDEYGFTVETLQAFWIAIQEANGARNDAQALKRALGEALRENTELRTLFVNQGVVDELDGMHKRLDELMARLNTAKIIPMKQERAA